MTCDYKIDPDKRIITHWFRGDVYVEDFKREHLRSLSDLHYDASYNILIDLRGCTFKNDPDDVKGFIQLLKKHPASYGIKHAILVESPIETAIAVFYRNFAGTSRKVNVFSTYEAAMKWLIFL